MRPTSIATGVAADTLVEQARAGDPEAWHRIVTDLGPRLRGYARARGVGDPDDLTQEVFTAAAERIGDFSGDDEALRSWLFSIAYRRIVDRYRRSRRRSQGPLPESLVDSAPSPEEAVVGGVEAGEAVAALEVLGDVERDIVLMRVIGELSSIEVAEAVGKRPGTVRVIQSRAMGKLRAELRRRGYGATGVWAAALAADLLGPLPAARASALAQAAAGTAASIAPGAVTAGAVAGLPVAAKVGAAVLAAALVGGGVAAVTGNLPDPVQTWVADLAERIGISLPHPDGGLVPPLDVVVPDVPLDSFDLEVPQVTLPDPVEVRVETVLPDPGDLEIPRLTLPGLEVTTTTLP